MKRTTVWLTKQQANKLKKQSRKTGVGVPELIRRAIDASKSAAAK
jgi:Ribbon-helix-helix domain